MSTPFEWFFRPFVEKKIGQILTLYRKDRAFVDLLATTQIARCFPLQDYANIKVEPSRRINLGPCVILIGATDHYRNPNPDRRDWPSPVGEEQLGERLREIEQESPFEFRDAPSRALVNRLTGETFVPRMGKGELVEIDYGVIRRAFRDSLHNTLSIEGTHRLGTLSGSLAVTIPSLLEAIRDAVKTLPDFEDSALLEILVKGTFDPQLSQGVLTMDAVTVELLQITYKGQWLYDFRQGQRWVDMKTWNYCKKLEGTKPPVSVADPLQEQSLPRLEVQADLMDVDPETQELCRRLLGDGPDAGTATADREQLIPTLLARAAEKKQVISAFLARSDTIRIELIEPGPFRGKVNSLVLPEHASHIRCIRKRFLLNLILCRLFGCPFVLDDESIARSYPTYNPSRTGKSLASRFVADVHGKLRAGFRPLYQSKAGTSRNYFRVEYSRSHKTYALQLNELIVLVKIRFSKPISATHEVAAGPGISADVPQDKSQTAGG
ncbi:MAG: hypothetical protein AB1486_20905 [Planctomycetota bacterium]